MALCRVWPIAGGAALAVTPREALGRCSAGGTAAGVTPAAPWAVGEAPGSGGGGALPWVARSLYSPQPQPLGSYSGEGGLVPRTSLPGDLRPQVPMFPFIPGACIERSLPADRGFQGQSEQRLVRCQCAGVEAPT